MGLAAGTRLGAYEIIAPIGAGGMGEVYRGRDTKLGRDVAVKILPAAFALEAARVARFKREAQVLASLNHPHIAQIYGLEEIDGVQFLVLEFVDGETLHRRIAAGPIPIGEALPIATQIAEALEAAHEKGIIHRDLKPANIALARDGRVKVLDFGLAKAMEPGEAGRASAASAFDLANSPTITSPDMLSDVGVIRGTAAYMSPEQARGRAVDRRADVWAFACVLYEMLSGRRAFGGSHGSTPLQSVPTDEVDLTALPGDVPPSVTKLLRRCLERDPARRLSAIGDARFDLEEGLSPGSTELVGAAPPRRGSTGPWIVVGALAIVCAAAVVPAWRYLTTRMDTSQVRFTVSVPNALRNASTTAASRFPLVSPDGRAIAFIAIPPNGDRQVIWIRRLNAADAAPLPGTESATNMFWSDDARSIAFIADAKLKRIDLDAAAPMTICDIPPHFLGGTWNRDGVIVIAIQDGLSVVPASGALPGVLAAPDPKQNETALEYPRFLPDGRHLLYVAHRTDGARRLYVRSIDGGPPLWLADVESHAVYSSGYLLFSRSRALVAQPFDPVRLRLSGDARPVAENLFVGFAGAGAFDASATGVLAYRSSTQDVSGSELVWVDRTGKPVGKVGDSRRYYQVRLSPADKHVVATIVAMSPLPSFSLATIDLATGVTSVFAQEPQYMGDPVWSPDSRSVAYSSARRGPIEFYRREVGTRDDTVLYESSVHPKWLDDWSPDGHFVLFHVSQPGKLLSLSLGSDRTVTPLVTTPGAVDSAHFSHDGRYVAYDLNETGETEVWVASFPRGDGRHQISEHGGVQPRWRGDDREVFFLTHDGKMMSVAVSPDRAAGDLQFQAPRELFQSPMIRVTEGIDQYAVTRDGQRFLFPSRTSYGSPVSDINVITNWTASVK